MQKLHLFLTVVAIAILIYLCTREPECPAVISVPKVEVPVNASPDVKAAQAVAEIKTAQAEAQVAQATAQAAQAQVVVANEKAKDAAVKLQSVKQRLYSY